MNDSSLMKMFAIGALTVLAVSYFAFVQKDGAIFGTVTTAIGTIVGYEIGARKNGT